MPVFSSWNAQPRLQCLWFSCLFAFYSLGSWWCRCPCDHSNKTTQERSIFSSPCMLRDAPWFYGSMTSAMRIEDTRTSLWLPRYARSNPSKQKRCASLVYECILCEFTTACYPFISTSSHYVTGHFALKCLSSMSAAEKKSSMLHTRILDYFRT